ncbi:Sodium:dicarboxylate symporter family protein [Rickettsiales bacterium Ac37b]|nr:Sodium:dicarboxylate symporter family protein [Rickettsiales bacterium Ac37b]
MFHKMPFILLILIVLIVILNPIIPLQYKQFLYSISLSIKSIITFLLPFIIFGLLFKTSIALATNTTKIIVSIIALVCVSNFCSTMISHYVGAWVYKFDFSIILPQNGLDLQALWSFNLPKILDNDHAMFASIIAGILCSKSKSPFLTKFLEYLEKYIASILKAIIYIIPMFIVGFIVKLQYDGKALLILKEYSLIFLIIALAQFTYIFILYYLLNHLSFTAFLNNIKNMLPAAISAFSSMSSAASMPLTIIGAENNAKNKHIIRSVIPITVNIHLIGDCFAIPILAYAIIKSFGLAEPSLMQYVIFALYFVIAKFSVAAIPGGGIIVMLPILNQHLGFNTDMMPIITTLYILFDPIITCANVLGNGAFAQFIDKLTTYKNKEIEALSKG